MGTDLNMRILIRIMTAVLPVATWRKKARDVLQSWLAIVPHKVRGVRFGGRFVLHGSLHATKFCSFADDVHVNSLHVEGVGELKVGAHTHFGREILVITSSHDYKGEKLPYGSRHIVKPVRIGECVWIGDRVTILPGSDIGDGVIVQAGAVVHGKIPALSIVGGNPAVPFAARNPDHYNELRQKGAYKK